ncbi:MAG: SDR family NAD(P)-dependent oxidoreductase [Planctomycetota bacterium]|jgi:short-subunit dehydrogenase
MARDLHGKVIVITGASSGIGAATALACAGAGMNVVLNARRADKLDAVADRVRQAGVEAATVVGDVTEEGISERMLDAAQDRFGRFDAVFANAGYGFDKAAHEVSDEALRTIFDVNFFASVDLCNLAADRLLADGRPGHLLMCSSCLGRFTLPGYSAYSATKAAQAHVCTAMRLELEPQGIYVSSVHPITTVTEFHEVSQRLSGKAADGKSVPEHAPRLFVQPAERVANAVVRCLRRPRPEVWTSFATRAVAALMTLSPRVGDVILRKARKHGQKKR